MATARDPGFGRIQFDVKLQIAGLNNGYDRVIERTGTRPGSVFNWCYSGETLLAVDAINDPRAYMTGKRMIEASLSPTLVGLSGDFVA